MTPLQRVAIGAGLAVAGLVVAFAVGWFAHRRRVTAELDAAYREGWDDSRAESHPAIVTYRPVITTGRVCVEIALLAHAAGQLAAALDAVAVAGPPGPTLLEVCMTRLWGAGMAGAGYPVAG